jgi:hypothetical protein
MGVIFLKYSLWRHFPGETEEIQISLSQDSNGSGIDSKQERIQIHVRNVNAATTCLDYLC